MLELASRVSHFEPTRDTFRATHPRAAAWAAAQQQQDGSSSGGGGGAAAFALLGYDPRQGPATADGPTAAAPRLLPERERPAGSHGAAGPSPPKPLGRAATTQPATLPAIRGAAQRNAQVCGLRREPAPLARANKLWQRLKSGASGGLATADGRASRAHGRHGDSKETFRWGATARLQLVEDQKRAAGAEARRRVASDR